MLQENRRDLMAAFNAAKFTLRHYVRGYFPVHNLPSRAMPVNRLFFPLRNPGGARNFIADDRAKHVLRPGKVYFVPAFLPTRWELDEELYFLSLHCSLEIFPGADLFSGCPHMLEVPAKRTLTQLLKIFDSDPEDRFRNAVRAGSLLYGLVTSLLAHYPPEDFWKPLALKEYEPLTGYLDAHGTARTQVEELAVLCGESREHFSRRFAARTGITPKQLIDRFVTGRCLTLLGEGRSFKEIAEMLEFSSEFAFSRYFKRNTGESPRNWRDRQKIVRPN